MVTVLYLFIYLLTGQHQSKVTALNFSAALHKHFCGIMTTVSQSLCSINKVVCFIKWLYKNEHIAVRLMII